MANLSNLPGYLSISFSQDDIARYPTLPTLKGTLLAISQKDDCYLIRILFSKDGKSGILHNNNSSDFPHVLRLTTTKTPHSKKLSHFNTIYHLELEGELPTLTLKLPKFKVDTAHYQPKTRRSSSSSVPTPTPYARLAAAVRELNLAWESARQLEDDVLGITLHEGGNSYEGVVRVTLRRMETFE